MWALFRLCKSRTINNVLPLTAYRCQECAWRCTSSGPRKKLRFYLITRYLDYLKHYPDLLEKRFPAAVRLYRVFSVGIKEFNNDLLLFFQAFKKASSVGEGILSHKELIIYHRMPKEMIKVAPVLLVSALPFGGAIFPLAYMFPRALLSYHFWSIQQRKEYSLLEHKGKLTHFRPVFRCLQAQLRSLKSDPLHKPWSKVLGMLGSGVHPTAQDILECRRLFEGRPYHIKYLTTLHVGHLLRVHGMHRIWWRRYRLTERARFILKLDNALRDQGGPTTLSPDELRWACFFRGLNPANISQTDTIDWLDTWLQISRKINGNNLSLLLHAPILLGYNEPSNWLLLHS